MQLSGSRPGSICIAASGFMPTFGAELSCGMWVVEVADALQAQLDKQNVEETQTRTWVQTWNDVKTRTRHFSRETKQFWLQCPALNSLDSCHA